MRRSRTEALRFPDHGAQIESFLSKSLARVWQAQVARIQHRGKPLILLYYVHIVKQLNWIRAWASEKRKENESTMEVNY